MNSIASIALSGMNAATQNLGASAHNVANEMTSPFRRQQVVQTEQAGGGVTVSFTRSDQPGGDLAADIVQQMMALYNFKANLRTLQAHDEMRGALLDQRA